MNEQNDGGPAFPRTVQSWNGHLTPCDGMSLRDYFAGQTEGLHEDATANYASRFNRDEQPPKDDLFAWAVWFAKADATLRYIRADAMIAARAMCAPGMQEGV